MDVIDFARYIGALILVVGLVGAAGLAARRFGLGSLVKPQATRRLSIVETLAVSPRQRLMIVRRDGVEHLILSGSDGVEVIETGIPAAPNPLPITPTLVTGSAS
jgi:flagellar protein FliO/FliZ